MPTTRLMEVLADKNRQINHLERMLMRQSAMTFMAIFLAIMILFFEPVMNWLAEILW